MQRFKILILTVIAGAFYTGSAFAWDVTQVDIHGFVSQGYLKSSDNNYLVDSKNGSFEFNEVGINFSTEVADKLRIGAQLVSRDLGDAGNNQTQLDWGFADYSWRNELGVRVGKIKHPFGLYNEGRDVDMLRTWVLLPQSIYNEVTRDLLEANEGGELYGTISAGSLGTFEYQAVAGTMGNISLDSTNMQKMVGQVALPYMFIGETVDLNSTKLSMEHDYVFQTIWNTPVKGLRLGFTGETAKSDITIPAQDTFPERDITNVDKSYVLSGEYKWKDLTVAAEYYLDRATINFHTPEFVPFGINETTTTKLGYYGSIAYRFTDLFELGSYYSVYYPNKDDKSGDTKVAVGLNDFQAWQKDTCLTMRFDVTPNWIIKLEGHHMDGTAQVYDYDSPADLSPIWSLYAVKTTFSF